ncbi:TIR domain-containing protein [Actinoallomurus sp. NPDC050550]|uniref:TIR domain-containing protein n=1 Tax=Actinoallomurus sp. NPDC050550 TaxID=3154937 RepID=UPI003401D1E3
MMAEQNRCFDRRSALARSEAVLTRMAWSPSGDRLAVPDQAGVVRVVTFPEFVVTAECRIAHNVQLMAEGAPLRPTWSGKPLWTAAWSSDAARLAVAGRDNTVHVFDMSCGDEVLTLVSHIDDVHAIGWSDDDARLISASYDGALKVWDTRDGALIRSIPAHHGRIEDAYWEPGDSYALTGGRDGHIRVWNLDSGASVAQVRAHRGFVIRLIGARSSATVISSSSDGTVRVWDRRDLRLLHVIEGFTGTPHDLSLSHDERLLAVKDDQRSIRIYRTDTFELVELIDEPAEHHHWYASARFHPHAPALVTTGDRDRQALLWWYDTRLIDQLSAESSATRYANCRIGLLGNTGVGKTALSNALRGEEFQPTESTHATKVSMLDRSVVVQGDVQVVRETYLWDFAGQPIYRLLQRLDVEDLAAAVLVLDNRNTTDPRAEVREWETLLRAGGTRTPRIVVIARIDRGGLAAPISDLRWEEEISEFAGLIETSSKDGTNIAALRRMILDAVDWAAIPTLTSGAQFQRLRMFVLESEAQGRVLEAVHTLYAAFARHCTRLGIGDPSLEEFRSLLAFLDAEGLVRRLSFGNLVLLDPSLLRSYASMILIAAQRAATGDGTLREDDVLAPTIPLPSDERVPDPRREQDLLHAAVQEFVGAGVVIREGKDVVLSFPSAVRTPVDEDRWAGLEPGISLSLTGQRDHVYATLVVALHNSGLFSGRALWASTARFTWSNGHGSWVRVRPDDSGSLWAETRHETAIAEVQRSLFDEMCRAFLGRVAVDGVLVLRTSVACEACGTAVAEQQVRRRVERGLTWIRCNVCEASVDIAVPSVDRPEPAGTAALETRADRALERDVVSVNVELKAKRSLYDVFISYSHEDEESALHLAKKLMERGIRPWVDIWDAYPGKPWLEAVQEQIDSISCAAVLIGESGIGPWQRDEVWYFLQQFFGRRCPVIPVLLEGAVRPRIPSLLENMQWVDFRRTSPDPMDLLVWGITGVRNDGEDHR